MAQSFRDILEWYKKPIVCLGTCELLFILDRPNAQGVVLLHPVYGTIWVDEAELDKTSEIQMDSELDTSGVVYAKLQWFERMGFVEAAKREAQDALG